MSEGSPGEGSLGQRAGSLGQMTEPRVPPPDEPCQEAPPADRSLFLHRCSTARHSIAEENHWHQGPILAPPLSPPLPSVLLHSPPLTGRKLLGGPLQPPHQPMQHGSGVAPGTPLHALHADAVLRHPSGSTGRGKGVGEGAGSLQGGVRICEGRRRKWSGVSQ